jgi:hypothetical protein
VRVGVVPAAFACQAFVAVGTVACWACSSFPVLSDRRHLDRSGPTAAPWRLAPGFDGFSWSGHRYRGRQAWRAQALPARMDLPGHRLSAAVAEPSCSLSTGPKRLALWNIDSLLIVLIGFRRRSRNFSFFLLTLLWIADRESNDGEPSRRPCSLRSYLTALRRRRLLANHRDPAARHHSAGQLLLPAKS